MFNELLGRLTDVARHSGEVISLGLKDISGTFTPVSIAWYRDNGYQQIYEILSGGGSPSWAGEPVSRQIALQHPVVWACDGIVSGSIGFLPAHLMRRTSNGERADATDHPLFNVIKYAPNEEMTSQNFRETLTSHCLLEGNGYAQIIRRSGGTGTAIRLRLLRPEMVQPDREKQGQKRLVYLVKENQAPVKTYTVEPGKPQDILHLKGRGWDGMRGYAVIRMAKNSIGSAIAADKNAGRFWAMGGRLPYVLNRENHFRNDEDFQRFRRDWEVIYNDPHRAPILEDGVKYQQIGISNKDSQAVETRQMQISEICRWFNVSPHLVGDLSRATFSNIEHLALEFVKMTLSNWIVRWEQEFWRCVLTPEEKEQGYFLKHNLNGLLRGDFQTRMAGYSTMLQNGIASQNEIRELEDWNPYDGGDDYHIQLNMQSLTGETQPAGGNSLVRLGGKR